MSTESRPKVKWRWMGGRYTLVTFIGLSLTAMVACYILSYALVLRIKAGADDPGQPFFTEPYEHPEELWMYRAVEWLVDSTPFRQPLLWWADRWGVAGQVTSLSAIRGGAFPYDTTPRSLRDGAGGREPEPFWR